MPRLEYPVDPLAGGNGDCSSPWARIVGGLSLTSGFGTKRTNEARPAMSVDGGRPEVAFRGRQDRF